MSHKEILTGILVITAGVTIGVILGNMGTDLTKKLLGGKKAPAPAVK